MQIKSILLFISLLIALSSIGNVSAIAVLPPEDNITTPADTGNNSNLTDTLVLTTNLLVETTTPATKTSTLVPKQKETTTSMVAHGNQDNLVATIPTISNTETNTPESTKPTKEPEIPSAALASGIVMVLGGVMLRIQ